MVVGRASFEAEEGSGSYSIKRPLAALCVRKHRRSLVTKWCYLSNENYNWRNSDVEQRKLYF